MDREYILKISKDFYYQANVSYNDAISIIDEYCREFGKSDEDIEILHKNIKGYFLSNFLRIALEYYEKKFHICKIFNISQATNNVQFQNLLLIY